MARTGEAALIVGGSGIAFGLSALFHSLSLSSFTFGLVLGMYLGFAALPFFDRRKWKPRPRLCSLIAVAIVATCCYTLDTNASTYWIAMPLGGLVGYFAPVWAPSM